MRVDNNEAVQTGVNVSVSRFGHDTIAVNVPVDSSVRAVLSAAGIELQGNEKAFVSGVEAPLTAIIDDGDVVSIVSPKEAG